nr:RNA-directed RNA polymerase [Mute swan feces associated toti-like virus 2]
MLPAWIAKPRQVGLSVLRRIEAMYRGGWISAQLYDSWMGVNLPLYQVAGSSEAMRLWADRLPFVSVAETGSVADIMYGIGKSNSRHTLRSKYIRFKYCRHHNKTVKVQITKVPVTRLDIKILNVLFPFSAKSDKAHTNLDVASLVLILCKQGHIEKVNRALSMYPINRYNVTVAAGLIMAVGSDSSEKMFRLWEHDKACCLAQETYAKYCQSIGTALRRNAKWYDGKDLAAEEVAHLAYWDLPIGRQNNVSDWPEEARKRHNDVTHVLNPWTKEPMYDEYRKELRRILTPCLRRCPPWSTWRDFVMRRQSWVSTGSSGGQSLSVGGEKLGLKKRAYFDLLTADEMLGWLDTEPKILATGSEKYEMGKARPIYGTMPLDYAIMSYVIKPIEQRLWMVEGIEQGLTGFDEMAGMRRRLKIVSDPYSETTMVDYADFNFQHTPRAQAEVFYALLDIFRESHEDAADLLKATEWCGKALENQWSRFPHCKGEIKINQGLFSGVRGTNFINTLLNVAYFNVANRLVAERCLIQPVDLYRIHQGDDVWISNKSRLWAASLYTCMLAMGFEMRASKQLFDRGVGEFLRVRYVSGNAMGYLVRSVSTFLMRPLQSEGLKVPHDEACALNAQIQLLYRRGLKLEAANMVWWATVPHALKMKTPSGGGISIPLHVAKRRREDGGLDLGPPGTSALRGASVHELPIPGNQADDLMKLIPDNMSADWIRSISKDIQSAFDADAVRRCMHEANVSGSLRPIDISRQIRGLEKALREWKKLVLPSEVHRTTVNMEVILHGSGIGVPSIANSLDRLVDVPLHVKEWPRNESWLSVIHSAIAASPFRDISTAQRAMNVGVIDAAVYCLNSSYRKGKAKFALSLLSDIMSMLGNEVTIAFLGQQESGMTCFQHMVHPVFLEWLGGRALDFAILDACALSVRDRQQWFRIVRKWQVAVLRVAIKNEILVDLSRY